MNHLSHIKVPMLARERDRLNQLALRYGFSLEEFVSRILRELSSSLPTESVQDYKKPRELRSSLDRALKDYQAGRFSSSL